MKILSEKRGFSLCMLLTATIVATTSVQAKSMKATTGLQVGVNAMYSDKGFADYDNDIAILPSVFYEGNRFYARGNSLGYHLIKNRTDEVSAFAQYGGVGFDPDNANGQRQGLNERESGIFVGGSYMKRTPYGALRGQLATDATGTSNGTLARVSYLARYKKDGLTVYPSVGLQWQDTNYNDYYYGVTEQESAKTNLNQYTATDSIHPYMNVMANYHLVDNWGLFMNQSIAYHTDKQYDSPKVDSRLKLASTLGVTYRF